MAKSPVYQTLLPVVCPCPVVVEKEARIPPSEVISLITFPKRAASPDELPVPCQ
jgi:hypothetical protein